MEITSTLFVEWFTLRDAFPANICIIHIVRLFVNMSQKNLSKICMEVLTVGVDVENLCNSRPK